MSRLDIRRHFLKGCDVPMNIGDNSNFSHHFTRMQYSA